MAVETKASCIVTGGKDLLVLDPFQNIRTMSAAVFELVNLNPNKNHEHIRLIQGALLVYKFILMSTLAERIIQFNTELHFDGVLPAGVRIMNPFKESPAALAASSQFYRQFYGDNNPRHIIMGINPGRFGSALTGVPFTDPKRLKSEIGITIEGAMAHEPSSVFIYEMINAFGGPAKFYSDIYITSVCPLGFTNVNKLNKDVNYNYYDSLPLTKAVYPFIVESLKKQIQMGLLTDVCFCFGTGQNEKFIRKLNDEHRFFKQVIALEHPRYIMQYKIKTKQFYIDKYLAAFSKMGDF